MHAIPRLIKQIYDEVHPSADFITDLPNHVLLSLKQWRKSFIKCSVASFVYPPKPNKMQHFLIEMMKAAMLRKRLPLRSQYNVFPLYAGIKKAEFIIQAYLYLLPE